MLEMSDCFHFVTVFLSLHTTVSTVDTAGTSLLYKLNPILSNKLEDALTSMCLCLRMTGARGVAHLPSLSAGAGLIWRRLSE